MNFVVSATQFLSVFLTSEPMEIISFDCSSDEEEEEEEELRFRVDCKSARVDSLFGCT